MPARGAFTAIFASLFFYFFFSYADVIEQRLHGGAIADELAPWLGSCPNGHVHYRYKRPTRTVSCAKCSRRFDLRYEISWQKRATASRSR